MRKSATLALILIPAVALLQMQMVRAQEHGTGHLDIAFSEAGFSLSLVVPGADILGFGGAADTDDDRTQVAVAISDLSKPLELFVLPDEAGCFTASANVTLSGEGLGQEGGAAQAEDQIGHSEIQADYQIQCQDIGAITAIQFVYFDRFPNAERLIVRVDQSGETRSYDITRAAPDMKF